jgi:hypothetical protein
MKPWHRAQGINAQLFPNAGNRMPEAELAQRGEFGQAEKTQNTWVSTGSASSKKGGKNQDTWDGGSLLFILWMAN